MNIDKISIKKLIPADYNPRKDLRPGDPEYEKLKRSFEEFGYVEPIIWNKTTGRVVGGHQRLKVLLSMGMDVVDCVVVEMDEEKEKALNIALNKISGEWDKEKLALLITDLNAADFDVSLTGFDPGELDDLFKDSLKDKIKEDDFDIDSELNKPAISRLGDVWILGRHRLVCGDSTNKETFNTLMDGKVANLVVTDPPYNVNYEGTAGKIKNDNMANDAFYKFLLDAFINIETALATDGSIYVFHADTEDLILERHLSMQVFIFLVLVFGRSNPWFLEDLIISGSMNQYSLVGKRRVSISGIQTASNQLSGNLINLKECRPPNVKPVSLIAYQL